MLVSEITECWIQPKAQGNGKAIIKLLQLYVT